MPTPARHPGAADYPAALLQQPLATQLHAFAALAALLLGLVQLAGPKGTMPHRVFGGVWVLLMLLIAGSSFWIRDLRVVGPWSPIHLLSILTLAALPSAVWAAHRHRVGAHRRAMISLFCFALVGAGVFTLLPGRVMHAVVFGGWGVSSESMKPGAPSRPMPDIPPRAVEAGQEALR